MNRMQGDFYGLPTQILANEAISLEYLAGSGPRIVRMTMPGSSTNLLAEMPDIQWKTPYGPYLVRGGHRLWHSPEIFPRTYIPDNEGLQVEEASGGVRLLQPVEQATGIRKSMEIVLDENLPMLTIHHTLVNEGLWPVELAPWAITQVPLGGIAVLPQQVGALDATGLLPNRQLALWPYTRWSDPRLELHEDYLLVRGQALLPPCKVGYMNRLGWIGHIYRQVLFIKRFKPQTDLQHPDFNSNVECYCNDRFLEVETLAPFALLEPGGKTVHTEIWELIALTEPVEDIEDVRAVMEIINVE